MRQTTILLIGRCGTLEQVHGRIRLHDLRCSISEAMNLRSNTVMMSFFDTDEDTSFTRAQLEGVLQRAGESQQANQQAIAQAHQQQVEREQQQGEGILRTLGRGTMRVGRNIVGGLATGQDLTTSVVAGLAEPVLSGLGRCSYEKNFTTTPPPA